MAATSPPPADTSHLPPPTSNVEAVRRASQSDAFPGMLDELADQARLTITENRDLFALIIDLRTSLNDTLGKPGAFNATVDWDEPLSRYVIIVLAVYYEFYRSELTHDFPPRTVFILTPMQEAEAMRLVGMMQGTSLSDVPGVMKNASATKKFFDDMTTQYKVSPSTTPSLAFTMHRMPDRSALLRAGIMGSFMDMMRHPEPGKEVSMDTVMSFLHYRNHFNYIQWGETRATPMPRRDALIQCIISLTNAVIARTEAQVAMGQQVDVTNLHNEFMSVLVACIIAGILHENRIDTYRALGLEDFFLPGDPHIPGQQLPQPMAGSRAEPEDPPHDLPAAGGCHGGHKRGRGKRHMY
jgi:hypothetical protein